jgi:hypothetical protein
LGGQLREALLHRGRSFKRDHKIATAPRTARAGCDDSDIVEGSQDARGTRPLHREDHFARGLQLDVIEQHVPEIPLEKRLCATVDNRREHVLTRARHIELSHDTTAIIQPKAPNKAANRKVPKVVGEHAVTEPASIRPRQADRRLAHAAKHCTDGGLANGQGQGQHVSLVIVIVIVIEVIIERDDRLTR